MKARILIVDDDPDVRYLVRYTLVHDDFDVSEAEDGASALRAIKDDPPDMVLLDIMMPRLSGLEVLQEVRSGVDSSTVPVILLTARAQESDVERGFELGADDYITKPFSPRELSRRVSAVLSRVAR